MVYVTSLLHSESSNRCHQSTLRRRALSSEDAPLLAAVVRSGNAKLPAAPVTQRGRAVANCSGASASIQLAAALSRCLVALTTSGIQEGTAHARDARVRF